MSDCTAAIRIAELIQRRLDDTGWSMRQVADRAGLAPATIEALTAASSRATPRRATLVRLARGLDVAAEHVLRIAAGKHPHPLSPREELLVEDFRSLRNDGRVAIEEATRRLRFPSEVTLPDARAAVLRDLPLAR